LEWEAKLETWTKTPRTLAELTEIRRLLGRTEGEPKHVKLTKHGASVELSPTDQKLVNYIFAKDDESTRPPAPSAAVKERIDTLAEGVMNALHDNPPKPPGRTEEEQYKPGPDGMIGSAGRDPRKPPAPSAAFQAMYEAIEEVEAELRERIAFRRKEGDIARAGIYERMAKRLQEALALAEAELKQKGNLS
jgi:hypothetical protein